jgi:hypothetical protein
MGVKGFVVSVPAADELVEGHSAKKYVVETGNKRTLFFVFKSDDIGVEECSRVKKHLESTMAPDDDTKIVVFAIPLDDSFEILELEV